MPLIVKGRRRAAHAAARVGLVTVCALAASLADAQPGSVRAGAGGATPSTTVTFAPLGVPGSPRSDGIAEKSSAYARALTATVAALREGTSLASPITSGPISVSAGAVVGAVMGTGSPASVTQFSNALVTAGAPMSAVAPLAAALAGLSTATPSTAQALVRDATLAFNAFVAAAPATFFSSGTLSPSFIAVHAALHAITSAGK